MFKRIAVIFAVLLLVGGTTFFVLSSNAASDQTCPFCNPHILKRQSFYEDSTALALYTHKPCTAGHCLIIPKRHVVRFEDLEEDELLHLTRLIKKVHTAASEVFGTTDYLILEKNGRAAGQSVAHLHFHYVPRRSDAGAPGLGFLLRFYIATISSPISDLEMADATTRLRDAMDRQ